MDLSEYLSSKEDKWNTYFEYTLSVGSKAVSSAAILFVKPKHFNFLDPEIKLEVKETEDRFVIDVKAEEFAKFIELNILDNDCKFSDNYFDLSGGCKKMLRL